MPSRILVVYEHQRLVVPRPGRGVLPGEVRIDQREWDLLARYTDRVDKAAFRIGHNSIAVRHHVGYLQIGRLRLEILPKIGLASEIDMRGLLVHMLREVLDLRITTHELATVRSRAGALYDVLVGRFLRLVEGLIREGLVRGYREVEGNERCMRGRLVAGRHVRENVVHKERLYVAYPVFDADTLLNRILHQALQRVRDTSSSLAPRAAVEALLAAFPDVGAQPIRTADFDRVKLGRGTLRYKESLELARLLLLSERPTLRWGGDGVVSLLFDMNALFESYVVRQLRRVPDLRVQSQVQRTFWASDVGSKYVRPDVLVRVAGADEPLVIDTKWKVPSNGVPSGSDVRQLFAYLKTFRSSAGLLLYPRASNAQAAVGGRFKAGGASGGVGYLDLAAFHTSPTAVRDELDRLVREHLSDPHLPAALTPDRANGP